MMESQADGRLYSERALARVLALDPFAVQRVREATIQEGDDFGYLPDARLSQAGVERLLDALLVSYKKKGRSGTVSLSGLLADSMIPNQDTVRVLTLTVNPRICTVRNCESGRMGSMRVIENRLYLAGMDVPVRVVERDFYEALEAPRSRGRW